MIVTTRTSGIFIFLLSLLFTIVVQIDPVLIHDGSVQIQDFAYYMVLCRHWWTTPGNIYDLPYQLEVYTGFFGFPISAPMPVLWSPVTLLVFAPFIYSNLKTAHLIWIGISVIVAFFGNYLRQPSFAKACILGLLLFMPLSVQAGILGQISIIACGLFGFLARENRHRNILWSVAVMLVLAIKPSLLLPALALLVAHRQWKGLGVSLLVLLTWVLFCEVRTGGGMIEAYLKSLSMFNAEQLSGPYGQFYNATLNVNSLMVLKPLVGWDLAYIISISFFIFLQTLALFFAVTDTSLYRVQKTFLCAMSGSMLFAPYLGWYEELLLIPVVCLILPFHRLAELRVLNVGTFLLLAFILCRPVEVTPEQSALFFILRAFLLLLLAVELHLQQSAADRLNPSG